MVLYDYCQKCGNESFVYCSSGHRLDFKTTCIIPYSNIVHKPIYYHKCDNCSYRLSGATPTAVLSMEKKVELRAAISFYATENEKEIF